MDVQGKKVEMEKGDELGGRLGLGGLDETAALEPAADARVGPVLVGCDKRVEFGQVRRRAIAKTWGETGEEARRRTRVSRAVVVLAHEVEELVARVGRLGLDDAVALEPVALRDQVRERVSRFRASAGGKGERTR